MTTTINQIYTTEQIAELYALFADVGRTQARLEQIKTVTEEILNAPNDLDEGFVDLLGKFVDDINSSYETQYLVAQDLRLLLNRTTSINE